MLARIRSFFRTLLQRTRVDREMDDEMRFHLEARAEELMDAGMPREEARRRARLEFGSIDKAKEAWREARGVRFFDSLAQDLRFGVRMLRKSPGFTAVAILTLALGIGANTAIFSVVNGILLERLPYAGSSQLVTMALVSLPEFRAIEGQCTAFERLNVFGGGGALVLAGTAPAHRSNTSVSPDFFSMLGVEPLLGRVIQPGDAQPGQERVAVLSYNMWMDIFGGDPRVVGRTFTMDDKLYSVIGVMPREFEVGVDWLDGRDEGAWIPLLPPSKKEWESSPRFYLILARLKEGVTLKEANSQLKLIEARLATQNPKAKRELELAATKLMSRRLATVREELLVLFVAVGILLFLACVNLSALLVARAWSRQKEIAIRKALGASRARIVQQLLVESVLLSLTGGVLGLFLSLWGVRVLRALAPPHTPRIERLGIDGNVLIFTLGASLLAALLFGLAPALQATSRKIGGAFKASLWESFAGMSARRLRLRSFLVAGEAALAVILVVGALLMLRSFERLMRLDIGVRVDHVLTLQADFSRSACNKDLKVCALAVTEIFDRIRDISGVQHAAISEGGLLSGGTWGIGSGLHVEGLSGDPNLGWFAAERVVTPGYFEAMGTPRLKGRGFTANDLNQNAPAVAVVSESFARQYLPGDPLGRRFSIEDDDKQKHKWIEVVGVVKDTRDRAVSEFLSAPVYYEPMGSHMTNRAEFEIRTSVNPMAIAPAVEQVIWSVDREAVISAVQSLDQLVETSAAQPRFQTALLVTFGALGLLMAVIGIYGVISYSVAQRTHEIGVRMALGADSGDVLRLFVGQGVRFALAGIAVGTWGAYELTRYLRAMLFEIKPTDPVTFVGAAVLFLAVAAMASYVPARRAMRVDPVIALRHE